MDMIPSTLEPGGFVPQAGGAALNTARALGRLGCASGFVGGLSSDMFGRQLSDALLESGVDLSQAVVTRQASSLAFVSEGPEGPEFDFYDEGSVGRSLRVADLTGRTMGAQAALFGGISLAIEPGAEAFARLAQEPGPLIMVDPNIRPALISDEQTYRARLRTVLECADIVKLSVVDLDWLVPGSPSALEDLGDLGDRLGMALPAGQRLVFLTDGGNGAHAILPQGGHVHVPAVPVQVVNTVGAGDAFNAGVLAGLAERGLLNRDAVRAITAGQLVPVMEFAAKVAAAAVSRDGAAPPWRKDIFPAA